MRWNWLVAIGKAGSAIGEADALGHVFGCAIGIDLTRRDRQAEVREAKRPWEVAKAFDHSAPCGPLHRADPSDPAPERMISLTVDGAERQRASTADMIWNVREIIARLSQLFRLEPGDLIFTGTPAGVGPVRPGQTLAAHAEGLTSCTVVVGKGS